MEITNESINEIIKYAIDPLSIPSPFINIFIIARYLFFIFAIFSIFLIVYILITTSWLKFKFFEDALEFIKFRPYGSDKYYKDWKKISKQVESGIEAEYKLAIIKADTILNEVLESIGYTKGSTEEKIKQAGPLEINNFVEIQEARIVRNGIIHDPDYDLSYEKTKEVLAIYKETIKTLGI